MDTDNELYDRSNYLYEQIIIGEISLSVRLKEKTGKWLKIYQIIFVNLI